MQLWVSISCPQGAPCQPPHDAAPSGKQQCWLKGRSHSYGVRTTGQLQASASLGGGSWRTYKQIILQHSTRGNTFHIESNTQGFWEFPGAFLGCIPEPAWCTVNIQVRVAYSKISTCLIRTTWQRDKRSYLCRFQNLIKNRVRHSAALLFLLSTAIMSKYHRSACLFRTFELGHREIAPPPRSSVSTKTEGVVSDAGLSGKSHLYFGILLVFRKFSLGWIFLVSCAII